MHFGHILNNYHKYITLILPTNIFMCNENYISCLSDVIVCHSRRIKICNFYKFLVLFTEKRVYQIPNIIWMYLVHCIKMNVKWASLLLCRIWGFHYEECRLLGCGAVWILWELTFQGNFCFVVVELNDTDRETDTKSKWIKTYVNY
jgi:hypothetical protein